jgi:hypothetical protein
VPSGPRKNYRSALLDVYGDSPFTKPPLKAVKLRLHVAGKQHRLAGCGYKGSINIVEEQLGKCGSVDMSLIYRLKSTGGKYATNQPIKRMVTEKGGCRE